MALACTLALLWLAEPSLALVHGGEAAPDAWAAQVPGGIAVCWSPGPGCFEPVRIDPGGHAPDQRRLAPGWAVAFVGPSRAMLVDAEGWVWRVHEGQRSAEPWREDTPLPGRPRPPRRHDCGPHGPLPVSNGTRLAFTWAPCGPDPGRFALRCPARLPPLPRRRIPPLELDLWFEAAATLHRGQTERASGLERHGAVFFGLSLALDPARRARLERVRALALTAGVRTLRLPVVAPGPLAGPERDALWRALCEGPPPWSTTPDSRP